MQFAEQVLRQPLMPWQRWLLIHALELLPDGTFRFRFVVVLMARQNGKSLLGQVLALFFLYVRGARLVIGTAQNLDIAEEVWKNAVDLAEGQPELADEIARVSRANGKKALELVGGGRYKVQPANRRGGRSLSGDLILMDELREHQHFDSWSALVHTTNARANAQVWALSNAGDAASVVLARVRDNAHAALGDPDRLAAARGEAPVVPEEFAEDEEIGAGSLGIFEWSAPPGASAHDRQAWRAANPSLGYVDPQTGELVGVTAVAIDAVRRVDPADVFRQEVLCQWSVGTAGGPFPAGAWEACRDDLSSIGRARELVAAVDVSAVEGTWAHIALAGLNQTGDVHVEIAVNRAGVDWVVPWLVGRCAQLPIREVVVQARGAPASPLLEELTGAGVPTRPWTTADMAAGTGLFCELVRSCGLRHLDQPDLDLAASIALTRAYGDAFVWNRRGSPKDIAPLVAATAAVWALRNPTQQLVSAYESGGLVIA